MTFARVVFVVAGIWGIVVLTPFYWLVDVTGRQYAPPAAYPHFFYGFVGVALVWQIVFLMIGSNPERFRAFMIPAMLEKFSYVATLAVVIASQWTTPGETERGVAWARDTFKALTPHLAPTRYLNYLEEDAADPAAVAYGPHLRRLQELKAKWDPDNFFRRNVNILPRSGNAI